MFRPVTPGRAQKAKQKTADECADYAERSIEPKALTTSANNLVSNEPRDQTEYNPARPLLQKKVI